MPLKPVVDTLDDVPEVLRPEYEAKEGKFHLKVEGFVPKATVDEFRNNNIALRDEVSKLKGTFGEVNLDEYRALKAKEQAEKDKKLIDAGKVDELVEERVKAMRTEYETKMAALNEESGSNAKLIEKLTLDNTLSEEAVKAGVRETALRDVMGRAREVFRVVKGKIVPDAGGKELYNANSEPLSVKEWLVSLAKDAPHLFSAPSGGGAQNGGNPGPTGIKYKSQLATPEDKSKFITEHGLAAFQKLPIAPPKTA